jgi:hypothetical protein
MRERVAMFGGHFEAGPTPAGGWRVRTQLTSTTASTELDHLTTDDSATDDSAIAGSATVGSATDDSAGSDAGR